MTDTPTPPKPAYVYKATLLRVIDGDTIRVRVDHGMNIYSAQNIRIKDIDCPELRDDEGKESKDLAIAFFVKHGMDLVIETYKDKRSFNRYVADVWSNDIDYAEWMVDEGAAVRV